MSEETQKKKMNRKELREKRWEEGVRSLKWERLDNTANLFPVISGEELTSVYRVCTTLTEEVDPEKLQKALDIVLPKFDGFNVRLRQGLFWYYFEENGKPAPRVYKENHYPCRYIHDNRNNSYLFRVSYYERRINVEVFHALTDGMGGMNFLKELTYQYLRLVHPELRERYGDELASDTSLNREDSFLKNYTKKKKGTAYGVTYAARIKAERLKKGQLGIMHVHFQLPQLKELAHKLSVSLNDLLVADMAYSIFQEQVKRRRRRRPIRINVPVNLRPYFESVTTKNFFVMVSAEFRPTKEDYTFEEVLSIVHEDLKKKITKENLEVTLSYNVSKAKNWIAKVVPLFFKNQGMLWAYRFIALSNTSTVTNVGTIKVAEGYRPYVEMIHGILSASMGQYLKGTICSYGDTLAYTFASLFKDTQVERRFIKTLTDYGLKVSIHTNGVYYK